MHNTGRIVSPMAHRQNISLADSWKIDVLT